MAYPAAAVLAGGNVRVGLEDNLYLSRGVFATNAQLVEKAATVVENMGAAIIGPDAVREKLGDDQRARLHADKQEPDNGTECKARTRRRYWRRCYRGGWVARLIQNGVDVAIFDPDPEAPRKIGEIMKNAQRAITGLTMAPLPAAGALHFATSIADAVGGAALIVEAVPERLDIKQSVYAEIEAAAPADAIISSSTSGILPTDLQAEMKTPERLLVGHRLTRCICH